MEPKPLKTFRTEFSIYEQSDGSISISSTKRLVLTYAIEKFLMDDVRVLIFKFDRLVLIRGTVLTLLYC